MQSTLDAFNGSEDDSQAPLMANLDQQLKLLKRELKTKDDKIARLTEHAVMMGSHMDRLKGEVSGDMMGAFVSFRGYFSLLWCCHMHRVVYGTAASARRIVV
jgi:hypothetical protein